MTNSDSSNALSDVSITREKTALPCVNCQQTTFTKLFDSYDFDSGEKTFSLEKCCQCLLTRTDPVLNHVELSQYYDSAYYGSADKKFNSFIESLTIRNNNHLADKILKTTEAKLHNNAPAVLDIGCGRANLLKAFNRRGCRCFGVERSDFPDDNDMRDITIYKQDFDTLPLKENSFDIVIIWHVLEHLTNPAATLDKIAQVLKPNGSIILAVPNFGGYQSKLFGKHWFHLDLPRHTYHFTNQSLSPLLNNSGLSIVSVDTRSFDQGIYGFVQSAINRFGIDKPNRLYSLLKTRQKDKDFVTLSLHLLLATIFAPFALLEYVISGLTGNGACLIVQAKKTNPRVL